jgi:hypothetical protein
MTYFDPSPSLTRMMSEAPLEKACAFDAPTPVVGKMSGTLLATLGVSLWAVAAVYTAHFLLALA